MSQSLLECTTKTNGARTIIMSPIIGRVRLTVAMGDMVRPGQIIGDVQRVNQRFKLKLPEMSYGKIVLVNGRDRVMPYAYGEVMFEIEEALGKSQADNARATVTEKASASVDAPMDGMFYLAPSPKDPPYVKVGDIIAPGQTIGLIEVMKCFYPLKYQGRERVKIIAIKVKSASPVSLGAPILLLEDG